MKRKLKKYLKKLGFKGRIRNHSSKKLWVIESTTNHPHGPPVAHILEPGKKSPGKIDADGFKRLDGKPIGKHKGWWKITDISTADVFDSGQGLITLVAYKAAVSETHFGKPKYSKAKNWGVPINYIVGIERKSGRIAGYHTSHLGYVEKQQGVKLALQGEIDLAVVVRPSSGDSYLRSFPGRANFDGMA